MSFLIKISFAFLAFFLLESKGCSSSKKIKLDTDEYINWVENKNNGLIVEKKIGDYIFSLQYKPLPYVVMQDNPEELSVSNFNKKLNDFSDMQYFTFRISDVAETDVQKFHINDDKEYYARLQYFALEMQNDLQLVDGKDTLSCLMFHYERTYGIDPRASFVMAFKQKNKTPDTSDKTLIFSDRNLGVGPVMITISGNELSRTPDLNLR